MSDIVDVMNTLEDDEHTMHSLIEWFNNNFIKSSHNEFIIQDIQKYVRVGVPVYLCGRKGRIKIEHIRDEKGYRIYRLTDKRARFFKHEQNKSIRDYRLRNRRS